MRITLPWGIFGHGNIGDEAMLQGFASLVRGYPRELSISVAAHNPDHARLAEGTFRYYKQNGRSFSRWWALHRGEAELIVGDTPIGDRLGSWPLHELLHLVRSAVTRRRPIAFLGIGTEGLRLESSKEIVSQSLAQDVAHWSVRSQRDRARLQEYGVDPSRINVAGDLAWLLETVTDNFGEKVFKKMGLDQQTLTIGVNFTDEAFVQEEAPDLPTRAAQLLDALIEQFGAKLVFFCNEIREGPGFDKVANEKIRSLMIHGEDSFAVENRYWTPGQMLSLVGMCDFTLSMRYHFCLFSALQQVPFIAIKRSDKVDDLCWQLDWPYAVSLTEIATPRVLELLSTMRGCRSHLTELLAHRAQRLRDQALSNRESLDAVCSPAAV